jgi:hypothetical protein
MVLCRNADALTVLPALCAGESRHGTGQYPIDGMVDCARSPAVVCRLQRERWRCVANRSGVDSTASA